jgi:LysM repeat protein
MYAGQRYATAWYNAEPGWSAFSPQNYAVLIAAIGLLFFLRPPACLAFEDPSPQTLFPKKTVASVRPSPFPRTSQPPAAHLVIQGDTLYSLSRRYGVSQAALMAANGLASPRELRAGMRLRLPGRSQTAPAPKPRSAASRKSAKQPAALPDPCRALNTPDIRPDGVMAGIADPSPGPIPPLSIPTTYNVNPDLTIGPEYKNAGASLLSNPDNDLGGYGAGLKARFQTKTGASLIGMFGYSMDFSASKNTDKALGVDANASIGGFGAGVGLRRSF